MKQQNYTLVALLMIILSISSCSTSNNYLTQTYKVNNPQTEVNRLKVKLNKPIITPNALNKACDYEETLEEMESSTFMSRISMAVNRIITEANTYLGTPYRYGGTNRRGIDCSSFMQHIYAVEGINLPRVSFNQARIGIPIKKKELQKGDLLFFSTTSPTRVTHVGMVVDVNKKKVKFIHASSSKGVSVSSLSNSYWRRKFRSARRPSQFLIDSLVQSVDEDLMASIN